MSSKPLLCGLALLLATALVAACGPTKEASVPDQPVESQPKPAEAPPPPDYAAEAQVFLDGYLADLARLEKAAVLAAWTASNSGKKEDFDAAAAAELELKKLHSNQAQFQVLNALLEKRDAIPPERARALEVAALAFRANQLPEELLTRMVNAQAEITQLFNTYRAELDGKKLSNNDLLALLEKEKKSAKRQRIWEALKQVGAQVGPKLVALAKVRNEAARSLGFSDFWDMQVRLQEHDPERLLKLFAELEQLTDQPFRDMKATLDQEIGKRLKLKPAELMPWHYDNPFFQAPPPSAAVDLNVFFKGKKKEDVVEQARRFYAEIGLPADDLIARSDFYEREGKDQHAFCTSVDRADDVRMLLNVKPTADWQETMLHETGHALYARLIRRDLPFNLRDSAHIFTTEAVAMLFGALGSSPVWLVDFAGANPKQATKLGPAIQEQRRREQLIFARWAMVMLHFERALYQNPEQDLDSLWYDLVERLQLLKRPAGRKAPDWAAKPHFTIAPVYYHNYQLGELFAAQLRASLARDLGLGQPFGATSWKGRADLGKLLTEKVFAPGMLQAWPAFVQAATGAELSAAAFAAELK
ncbi:MAG TPA: M2 family metallopeptidase [Myxococcota bacterium]|nr:M2 family metallopeptidase [Myxococcota bacterium]HRY94724.1 M2 family metallopeptidase [Myxococcota bacterium]HSA20053.1 M2 family metallopeptidase [Myxococcota bacterium]